MVAQDQKDLVEVEPPPRPLRQRSIAIFFLMSRPPLLAEADLAKLRIEFPIELRPAAAFTRFHVLKCCFVRTLSPRERVSRSDG
jgi:hypothetical protein